MKTHDSSSENGSRWNPSRAAFEVVAVVATAISCWVAFLTIIAGSSDELPSGLALLVYSVLIVAGPAAGFWALHAAKQERHGLAGVAFLIAAASPTFFFYIGNLLLVAAALWEWTMLAKRVLIPSRRP